MTTAGQQIAERANASARSVWADLIYNVKAYGAKGDGIADDSANIQSAINAANLVNGSVVYPDGTYLIKSQLTIPSGVKGFFSFGNTLLKFYLSSDQQGIVVSGTTDLHYSGLRHTQDPAHTSTLVNLGNTTNTTVSNCKWEITGGMGLGLALTTDTLIENCYFTDTGRTSLLTGHPSKPAIWVGETPTYTNVRVNISHCKFIETNWSGVYFFPQTGTIDHCTFENCGESSVFTSYGAKHVSYTNNFISGSHFVNIAAFGLEIGGAQHVLIANNTIVGCDEAGIGAGDLKDFIISNNTCHHNGTGGGASENKAGIVLRQTVADPLTTERGIVSNNHCYDEYDTADKVQLYGISTYKTVGSGFIREVVFVANDLMYNKTSAVYFVDETTIGGNVTFTNNLGYAQEPIVIQAIYPTSGTTFSVTGVGFRPRYVKIIAFLNDTKSKSISEFTTDTINADIVYTTENTAKTQIGTGACLLLMDDSDVTKTYATFTGVINDGLQFNVPSYSGPLTVKMIVTCYP